LLATVLFAIAAAASWTMGFQPRYRTEEQIYSKYILANKPDAKIGILYQK
jgi:branched-chain amino acid transport system substrate-binding protein